MNLPNNKDLPYFAYGLFKPGQICYFRIKELVMNKIESEVIGILKERDGIPLLIKGGQTNIKGVLIYFHKGKEKEGYERIISIEPDEVYKWEELQLLNGVKANVLIGKKETKGSTDLEHIDNWDGREDPYFKDAVGEIESTLEANKDFNWDNKSLFRLQMAYSLLWTVLERYAALRYHLGEKVNMKVYQIASEETFAGSLKKHVKRKGEVYSTTDLRPYYLDPDNPTKSIKYYYQVRCNSIHRGKAIFKDFDTIRSSLKELLGIYKDLRENAFEEN